MNRTFSQNPYPATRRPAAPRQPYPASSHWLFVVLGVHALCQIGLMFETLAPFRIVFRSGAYGINLVALMIAFGPKKQPHHPSFWAGIFCLIWVGIQIMHPDTNTAISAIAYWTLTAAVMAPLFWVPRLQITPQVIRNVVFFFWGFHTLSAFLGVLQVYYPGQYQPAISQAVKESQLGGENLKVTLAEGDIIYRPMGLSDMPGGAAFAGLYAFVFGLGLFSLSRAMLPTLIGLFSLPVGIFCILLTQVRVMMVLVVIISIVYAALLAVTRRFGGAIRTAFMLPVVGAGAFIWAVALGGESTAERFESLVQENPDKLYYKNRGVFLEDTFEISLPEYPFGAGLGRWGMINTYFGDKTLEGSEYLWVEIQWTAWVFDGGAVLLIAYPLAMVIAVWAVGRIAFDSAYGSISGWAMLILAYDVAMFAFTFSYAPFLGQSGVEFWLLNAMIWTAAQQYPRRPAWQVG
jgi:hypothetical protein